MIAVTGANGLLGSFIVRKLIEAGAAFVAIKRADSDISLLTDVHDKIRWVDADILDPVSIDNALKDVTAVIHSAAVVSFNPRRKDLLYDVNVIGTRNVVNGALNGGVKKIIHISSVAALGRMKGQTLIDENNKWTTNSLNSTYAETKYLAELEIYRGHEEGLETVIVNPSVILAAADWTRSSAKLFKYVWDEKVFYIENDLNYVDARDVADIVFEMIDRGENGERYILNAGAIPLKNLFEGIAARWKKRAPRFQVNRGLLKLLAATETWRSRLSGEEPLVTTETARLAGTHFLYSNQKVINKLNFKFRPIDQTLDWCCMYYLGHFRTKN